jgi:urease accessory protein
MRTAAVLVRSTTTIESPRMAHTVTANWTCADPQALLRLCQLVSPALPVGAYAYSQGLEFAVHAGWVCDETTVHDWLSGLARRALGTLELPILARLHEAWVHHDPIAVERWNARLMAARDTAELRAEERHLGRSLARVLCELQCADADRWLHADATFATLFSLAAAHWRIPATATLTGYVWAWSENQVLAAVKLVPLGQSAGQRLLSRLIASIPSIVARAQALAEDQIGTSAWGQGFASALHETQYSRLFRS